MEKEEREIKKIFNKTKIKWLLIYYSKNSGRYQNYSLFNFKTFRVLKIKAMMTSPIMN